MIQDETILSQARHVGGKVQRPERKLVGPSGPKRLAPLWGGDMVSSTGRPVAAPRGGAGLTIQREEKRDSGDAWDRETSFRYRSNSGYDQTGRRRHGLGLDFGGCGRVTNKTLYHTQDCVVDNESQRRFQRHWPSHHPEQVECPNMAKPYIPYDGPEITRADALARGLTRYFVNKPCKHGHLSERTSCNGGCIACNAISIAALYYSETAEKRAERQARTQAWKDAHRDQVRAEGRAYAQAHREEASAWKAANREKVNAGEREARLRDPEAYKARIGKYLASDKGKYGQRARTQNYRASLRGADGSHTREEIWALHDQQKGKCVYCRASLKKGYHADHIQPLSKGGSNWISNIQLTCGPCNNRKHATDPIAFAQRLGRLL